jgi:Flp pilus assembly protein TadG
MKLRLGVKARRQRGQSLVEFAVVLPVMAAMLAAVLEFGLALDTDMSLETASREGARVGAVLGNGGSGGTCPYASAEDPTTGVDATIVNTVKTSLANSSVDMSTVKISIFGAAANGSANTAIDTYAWVSGAFVATNGHPYAACGRHDGTFGGGTYDDIAVQIQYTYTSKTGLLSIFTGGLPMTAKAIFPIGPPWQ